VKSRKTDIFSKVYKIPTLKFENQSLSSFSGAIILQNLFQVLKLKSRIKKCFSHQKVQSIYGLHNLFLLIITHVFIGFKKLRGRDYYSEDPIIKRVIVIKTIPDVSTISRGLSLIDEKSYCNLRKLLNEMVLKRLKDEDIKRITLDFDGSVLSTSSHAEGTAVGYNKLKKGGRSYYPLFCTIAQTSQFFDLHHRAGNVHDSNGAKEFMIECCQNIKQEIPKVLLESRVDSAFYSREFITSLDKENVRFSASVPFERFPNLKEIILKRKRWNKIDDKWSSFESNWSPKSWDEKFRIIIMRQQSTKQEKGPLQLDLFEPKSHEFSYKVIVTNKTEKVKTVLNFHNGRGAQEKIFGEAKTCGSLGYIPFKKMISNKIFLLANMFTHNLSRELQMDRFYRTQNTNPKRAPLWKFESLEKLRREVILRAGRLTCPQGNLTLSLNSNKNVKDQLLHLLSYGT